MNRGTRNSILLLRIFVGFLVLYLGIMKMLDLTVQAKFIFREATIFAPFYQWLLQPYNSLWLEFIDTWGLMIVGVLLIVGFFTRGASVVGILYMLVYYFALLHFPLVGEFYYVVSDHVIYIICFTLFISSRAGEYFGLDGLLRRGRWS